MIIDETQIDWEELQNQKAFLIDAIEFFENIAKDEENTNACFGFAWGAHNLKGILHFIDYIQDTAIDGGWMPEDKVFKHDEEFEDADRYD